MLSGAVIYLYSRNILFGKFIFRKTDLLFFLPFVLYVLYYLPAYNQSAEDKIFDIIAYYNSGIAWKENLYEWIAEIVVTVPFLVFSVRLINQYHKNIKHNFSDISKISYVVVRNVLIASTAMYLIEVLIVLLAFMHLQIAGILNSFLYVFIIGMVYLLGYDALVRKKDEVVKLVYVPQAENKSVTDLEAELENNATEPRQKYEKNVLSETKIREISQKILICMINEKLYRNPELRLNDLAQHVGEHPNNVSQVLNDVFQKNFYDFMNLYRVEDAKALLKSPEYKNFTITAIGFEVGFNSKTAFFTAFKKFTNTTPAKFQKSI
jgi:AraC-like DNA-binding protein